MRKSDSQEDEIKTIRDRKIEIKLSDADVIRLGIVAGEAGLTPSELLSNFIGDLVDGTYSNGSDERYYARQWYDRCWFGKYAETYNLLQSLVRDKDNYAELLEGERIEIDAGFDSKEDWDKVSKWRAEVKKMSEI